MFALRCSIPQLAARVACNNLRTVAAAAPAAARPSVLAGAARTINNSFGLSQSSPFSTSQPAQTATIQSNRDRERVILTVID